MKSLKELKELVTVIRDPLALVCVLALIIYGIASLVLVREPNLYHAIVSVFAFLVLVVMLWLVLPGIKPKGKDLPPMSNCRIALIGKLKTGNNILINTAILLKAQVVELSAQPQVVIGNPTGADQKRKLTDMQIDPTPEANWNAWVEREINTYIFPKRLVLNSFQKSL